MMPINPATVIENLETAGLSFAHIPEGRYQVGYKGNKPLLSQPPQIDFIEPSHTPFKEINSGGFYISKDLLRLSHWQKIVSLAPFAHLSSLIPIDELEVIAARNSLETSTIVEATADDNQYYGTRQPSFEIPRQSEPDPVLQVTAETAASITRGLDSTLPRWNEWEIATRGEDGRLYPWGDEIDLSLLSIEYQNYSVDDEGVMGYYRYDQDVYFVHSFGDYVNQPSPFGLIGLARPGREWNLADADLPASEQPFILRSLSDLGGMAMMIPGFRPNTWGFGNWHKTKRELAFSGPSLPCYAEGNVGNKYNQLIYPTAGFRLVVKKK